LRDVSIKNQRNAAISLQATNLATRLYTNTCIPVDKEEDSDHTECMKSKTPLNVNFEKYLDKAKNRNKNIMQVIF
jgi:hypothetical protein